MARYGPQRRGLFLEEARAEPPFPSTQPPGFHLLSNQKPPPVRTYAVVTRVQRVHAPQGRSLETQPRRQSVAMAGGGRACRWGAALVICVALVLSSQDTEAAQKIKKFASQDMEVHWVETGRVKRGVITTPGFGLPPWRRESGPYRAAWLLQKQPGYQLVVYLTQNHLAYGDVSLYSFVACISEGHNKKDADCYWDSPERGPHSLASSETNRILVDGATSSAQPQKTANWLVVVANFTDEPGTTASLCLPSSRSHGLNFTYEMERMSVGQSRVRHRCSLRSCNLNGECLVSADFK